jgi:hypothetical protein
LLSLISYLTYTIPIYALHLFVESAHGYFLILLFYLL